MEDFFIDKIPDLKFRTARIKVALKDISTILESTKRNDFDLLCAIATLIKDSTHANYVYYDCSYLKYTYIDEDSGLHMVDILEKYFGFSPSYVEKMVRVINKFISAVDCGNYKYNLEICKDLTISKMIELLPLSISDIEFAFLKGNLTFKSTSKEIRDYVKSLKGKKQNMVVEDNNKTTSAVDCEDKKITDNGLYIKLDNSSLDYIKKVIKGKKYNYKTANDFLNALIKYAIEKELFL